MIIAALFMVSFSTVKAMPSTWTTTQTQAIVNHPGWFNTTVTTWTMDMYNNPVFVSKVVTVSQ